jgi:sulfate permease, SulP family
LVNVERAPVPECPQLKMLRIGGSLFFGAADYVERRLLTLSEQTPDQRHFLLVGMGMNFVDMARNCWRARATDGAIGGSLSLVE